MTKKHTNHNRARTFGRADRRDIPLENDAMFSTVMQYEDACRGLIETIFEGRRVRRSTIRTCRLRHRRASYSTLQTRA